ncbi:MAG: acetylxylan esterase [Balneolaceae bacterium]|nr:acetylxylan esterase [Balneolaceae bacterium]
MGKPSKYLLLGLTAMLFSCSIVYGQTEEEIRQAYLDEMLELFRPHPDPEIRPRNVFAGFERLSFRDHTWYDWLERTGELPPNFGEMRSSPFLPDPLILDEGGENIPIRTQSQWEEKRNEIKAYTKHFFSGTFPEPPDNMNIRVLETRTENEVTIERIELRFGPDHRARLNLEVMTPPGDGPFPVFMSQWNHRGWAQIAVRRGYIGLIYAGADEKDDTLEYQEIYPDYDWSALMTRAWGAHRAVDYLYTLDSVDTSKIAITGHSRHAQMSLLAAAFDNRITAFISSSGGTGGETPYRYTDERYELETMDLLLSIRPQWFHPRLRFFGGREHKLPIDQNSIMALIAPNSLLLSTSIREGGANHWGIEENYRSLKEVYRFLGSEDKLGILSRDGGHGTSARDIERFLDWLDIQFDRKYIPWENNLFYGYSFEKWKELSGEEIDPDNFSVVPADHHLLTAIDGSAIETREAWIEKSGEIKNQVNWLLGDEPPGVSASPIENLSNNTDYMDSFLRRPSISNSAVRHIAPYNALGDYLRGSLYYPIDENGEMVTRENGKLPVVIYLHEYSNLGFNTKTTSLFEDLLSRGIAVFAMDLIGYGTRIEEGTYFYDRYPNWSKLGKMVTDTRAAIDALESLEFIDGEHIFLTGYALGGTVSLFTSALDNRIAATAVSGAFTPLRNATEEVEGLKAYSHLQGLIPRLGFFADHQNRIPVDFPEIISAIAPRPLLVVSPELDRHADFENVTRSMDQVSTVYDLFNTPENLHFLTPHEFDRFTTSMRTDIADWFENVADRQE